VGRQGEDVLADFTAGLEEFSKVVEAGEIKKMLGGEHDPKNAIVTIHPGAAARSRRTGRNAVCACTCGGSSAAGFKRDMIDYQPGDEAGLKSATLTVTGGVRLRACCRPEAGVHRLVRISPFDQAARRHTSFASVLVWPELADDIEVEIEDKDIRIDTYRSSGAGGQHVNVT
jgi:peptide chain release factor 2